MKIREQVFLAIKEGYTIKSAIMNYTGLTHKQVQNNLGVLLNKGIIESNYITPINKSGDRCVYSITPFYRIKKIEDSNNFLFTYPYLVKQSYKSIENEAFSKNEMHYGLEGRKWSWEDVEKEAFEINYDPENISMNYMPIMQIDS